MSLSKAAERPREPKCSRCRHHGIIVPIKGHMRYCPFLGCDCWKCYLSTQRTRTTALMRNLKRCQNKELRPSAHTGVSVVKPVAERSSSASAAGGDARHSDSSGPMSPQTEDAPDCAASTACRPLDLRSRPATGGGNVAALDGGKAPLASSEEGSYAPYFGRFGQTPPLPVIHSPLRVSGHPPSSYTPCPNFPLNMPSLPPVPAGLYNSGFCGPLMPPRLYSGAVHYPPLPEPGPPADCRMVFFTLQRFPLPELIQEKLTSVQPPQSIIDLSDVD
ncbi:doublesex- and mab-3-related transcription factor 1Y-like [Chelmon rostratus]|uniref:doublesex- and mab-3-related transcription factor 1Y-like n=1 Tax=Chelmon rostratus TaxID=109905 RepID=UPI001BEB9129|nr:doublesex- and mab-3-related transcription factor 1Y-like [Chelmon rostratus]